MVRQTALAGKTALQRQVTWRVAASHLVPSPCQAACPAGVDAPRYIRYISRGMFGEALAVNRERLPLPSVCAYACFNPCEAMCALNQFGEPLAIRALKRAAVEQDDGVWKKRRRVAPATGKRVAVVGAGPCGLTAAYYLATRGHAVTVLDSGSEPGGILRYGIPRYRLPREALDRDIQVIRDTGATFRNNTTLGKDIDVEALRRDFDVILVATGASLSRRIEIEGVSLPGVAWGLEFLRQVASGEAAVEPRVLVVGGGNVAMDVALSARRLGARTVDLVCLEDRREMPAHEWEIARAVEEGIAIHNSWGPVRVTGGNRLAAEFQKCVRVFDRIRNFNPAFDPEVRTTFRADQLVFALGQAVDRSILPADMDRVFTAGDFATGPASIVQAIAQGREAASAIDRFLGGSGDIAEVLARPEKSVEVTAIRHIVGPRVPVPLLPVEERVNSFAPAEPGYDRRMAVREASRCLRCDARLYRVRVFADNCKACGYCIEVCRMGVFATADKSNRRGVRPVAVRESARCVGCLQCFYACPDFAAEVSEVRLDGGGAG